MRTHIGRWLLALGWHKLLLLCLVTPGGLPPLTPVSVWLVSKYPRLRNVAVLIMERLDKNLIRAHRYLISRRSRVSFRLYQPVVNSLSPQGKILDACCGLGSWSRLLSASKRVREVYAFDYSVWQVYVAKQYFAKSRKISFAVVDANKKLPYRPQFFDLIVANDCLMFLQQQKLFVQEIRRLIRPKQGRALLGHIHKRGAHNTAQGRGLSPHQIGSWLDGEINLMVSEELLVKHIFDHKLPLRRKITHLTRAFFILVGIRQLSIITANGRTRARLRDSLRLDPEDAYLLSQVGKMD